MDDLLLFGVVSDKQAMAMEHSLQHFCVVSEQMINMEKSQILFSSNVE